ncbi:MAG: ComF family protein [Porcipelethomonas sp.]
MKKIFKFLTDLIYPSRCPVCAGFVSWDELVCKECIKGLERADGSVCEGCGKQECICGDVFYDRAAAAFFYDGKAKDGILSLKDGQKEFGYYLGEILGRFIKESSYKADIIVPVPMSKERRRERGYNQAEIIAEKISEITGIRTENGILYKNSSAVQHTLNRRQRMENVSAFGIRECCLDGMKILLCDDVLTTGSTAGKCAQLLKSKGAAEVFAAVGTTTKLKKRNE